MLLLNLYFLVTVSCRLIPWFQPRLLLSAAAYNCSDVKSFTKYLPSPFEPSDVIWDASKQILFIISDDSQIVSMNVNGDQVFSYPIQKSLDLEAIAIVPHRTDYLYLGLEYPASILEYQISTFKITRKWNLQQFFDQFSTSKKHKNAGLESMVYLPTKDGQGYFFLGRQVDARVFVFNISLHEQNEKEHNSAIENTTLVGTFVPPGPRQDLSSMTLWRHHIWFLYDKDKTLHSLDYKNEIPLNQSMVTMETKNDFQFKIRGQEGISFVETADGFSWVFIAIDAPKKKNTKELYRYSLGQFFACFSSMGVKGIPN